MSCVAYCAQQTDMHRINCGSTAYSVRTVQGGKEDLYTPGARFDLLVTLCLAPLATFCSPCWRRRECMLQLALVDLESGKYASILQAAKAYKTPRSTLAD
jgi:hypothetical protein